MFFRFVSVWRVYWYYLYEFILEFQFHYWNSLVNLLEVVYMMFIFDIYSWQGVIFLVFFRLYVKVSGVPSSHLWLLLFSPTRFWYCACACFVFGQHAILSCFRFHFKNSHSSYNIMEEFHQSVLVIIQGRPCVVM